MGGWETYAAVTLAGCQGTASSFVLHGKDREAIFKLVLCSLT